MALQVNRRPGLNCVYKENSFSRWVCSVIIAFIMLFLSLTAMLHESEDVERDSAPLMELNYVVLDETKTPVENPRRIQPKRKEPQNTEKEPSKEVSINTTNNIPIEPATAPVLESDIPSAQVIPAPITSAPSVSNQPQRIGNTAELDNTDFAPVYNPKPDYPIVAQEAAITGFVDIDLVIDENGKVVSFSIVKIQGHPSFAVETKKVLPRWRFPPPRIGGKKVRVKYVYRVNFTLN